MVENPEMKNTSLQFCCESKMALKSLLKITLKKKSRFHIKWYYLPFSKKETKKRKGHKEIFGGDGYSNDFMGVCLCTNSSKCIH